MSIYKVERQPINESTDEEMEFVGIVEVVFDKYGELKEFRTAEDVRYPILESAGGLKDWTIYYTKNQKVKINVAQESDLEHGARIKVLRNRGKSEALATRSIMLKKDEDDNIIASLSVYGSQKKRKNKLNDDGDLTDDQLDAALSFVTDQAENLYNFVKGEYDYDDMQKYIDEYNSKSDSEKKKLAKQATVVK